MFKTASRTATLLLIMLLAAGCASTDRQSPYSKSAEQQKAAAEKAQRELSRETSNP